MISSRGLQLAAPVPGLFLGEGTLVDPTAAIGVPPRGTKAGELETRVGRECTLRSHCAIYAGATIGDRVQAGHGAVVREGNLVGSDVSIGTNAVLEPGNRIGDRVRIHTGCFLELVTVEDDVFIGPNVTFADDLHPPCPDYRECVGGAVVKAGAAIGANATVLPGVTIGEGALVGAGSVVARDVAPRTVVAGNPAREICAIDDLKCRAGRFERPYVWRERP